jgi:hypothetical protein
MVRVDALDSHDRRGILHAQAAMPERTMQIEVEEKVADLLNRLRAQAAARHTSFDAYLEQFVETADQTPPNGSVSLEEFDRVLDQLSAAALGVPSLPADFSRPDIYTDLSGTTVQSLPRMVPPPTQPSAKPFLISYNFV